MDLTGSVVSIDSIGKQVDIAQAFLDKDAHYFLEVKENQHALNEAIIDAIRYNKTLDTPTQMEADHGPIEARDCRIVYADTIEDKTITDRWPGIKMLVEITLTVDYGDHKAQTIRRYISDEDFPRAAYFNMLARVHWNIENQLYCHLDVTFKEDECRARKGYAGQNLSALRKLAMEIVKGHKDKRSVRKRLSRPTISQDYMKELLFSAKF